MLEFVYMDVSESDICCPRYHYKKWHEFRALDQDARFQILGAYLGHSNSYFSTHQIYVISRLITWIHIVVNIETK